MSSRSTMSSALFCRSVQMHQLCGDREGEEVYQHASKRVHDEWYNSLPTLATGVPQNFLSSPLDDLKVIVLILM